MAGATRARSLVKTVTYRILGGTVTMLVAWAVTGSVAAASSIAALNMIIKLVTYYAHERAWAASSWGSRAEDGLAKAVNEQPMVACTDLIL